MPKAVKVGVVTGNKMDKTVVVAVERLVRHPMYKRAFKKTSTFMAHDENNRCQVGDRVRIIESRPLSSRKALASHRGRYVTGSFGGEAGRENGPVRPTGRKVTK